MRWNHAGRRARPMDFTGRPMNGMVYVAAEGLRSFLSDSTLKAVRAYGVEDAENQIAWPAIFIVGKDGKVKWRSLAETFTERPASAVILDALGTAR